MKAAAYVKQQAEELKKKGMLLMEVAWKVALLCVGWPYVFGARGETCTPANRRAFYKSKGADHPTIKTKCQVIRDDDPKSSCNGCKWYPDKERVLFFDCRGFTYWVLWLVYGWKLQGAGATSQWDTKSNWKAQGTIDTCPENQLVCLFQRKKGSSVTMAHTGFGYCGKTVECQNGVQHFTKRNSKWTHWGLPACCAEDYVKPEDPPKEENKVSKPTLKKGASGSNVKELQKLLIDKGYSCGSKGADGKFGNDTLAAVKAFQKDNGLKVDGVVGESTWAALEKTQQYYRVTVSHVVKSVAEEIKKKYGGEISAE